MRFIVEWRDDSGDADRDVVRTDDSVEEVMATITNCLDGEAWYDDDAADKWHREHPGATEDDCPDFDVPAVQALISQETDDGDLPKRLAAMRVGEVVTLGCDAGELKIIRER